MFRDVTKRFERNRHLKMVIRSVPDSVRLILRVTGLILILRVTGPHLFTPHSGTHLKSTLSAVERTSNTGAAT
jgi:hypothetical protein